MNHAHYAVSSVVRHPIAIRRLAVHEVERPTPRLARIVLGGPELDGFVSLAPDDYARVFFPTARDGELALPEIGGHGVVWHHPEPPPPARHLTVCRYDTSAATLQLDVVLHDEGVAASWAAQAQPGESLGIGGPRESHVVTDRFEHYLLVADETGLPALARRLRELPARTAVTALIKVNDVEDEQDLETEATGTIRWLHRARDERLDAAIRFLILPRDRLYCWVAAEASVVQAIRQHLVGERSLPPDTVRARSYWRRGADGDEVDPNG